MAAIIFLGLVALLMLKFIKKEGLIALPYEYLSERKAALVNAIVWGDKSELTFWDYQKWKELGIVHMLVASGANVMLLVGGWIELTAWFLGRKKTIVVGLGLGWWYAGVSGFNPPVVRGVLMASVMLLAQLLGRKYNWKRALGLVFALMVVAYPDNLKSLSFWMSMIAFMAVGTYPVRKGLLGEFGKTTWVTWWLMPIDILVWNRVSLVAPLTNVLVAGVVQMVAGLGIIGSVVGQFIPIIGKICMQLANYPLDCLIWFEGVL